MQEQLRYFVDFLDVIFGVGGKRIDTKQFANSVIRISGEQMERTEVLIQLKR